LSGSEPGATVVHRQGRFRELAAEHPEIPQDRAGRERGQLDGVDRDDIPGLGAAHDDQPGYRRQRMPIASGANGVGIALNILDIVEGAADLNGQHRTTPIRGRRMLAGDLALMIAAVFTGAATTSTSSSSQRALQLDDRSFPAEWKPAYKRGYMMQASLAVVGGLFGLVAYLSTLDWRWLLGAIVLLANWPSTIFSRIGPTRSS